jgi:hypothetical protein
LTGHKKKKDWKLMAARIPKIESALNFFTNAILFLIALPKHMNFMTDSRDLLPVFIL